MAAGLLSGILKGGAGGAALGPWGMAAGAALSLAPTVAKWFTSRAQKRKANAINPIDPGFAENSGIVDNKRIVNDIYNNYELPGKAGIMSNLNASFANGMDQINQGASSSGDILDGATKLNFNQDQAINALGTREAEMKQGLLPAVLDANAAAGNELVRKNQFDNQRYQAQLEEKAALNNAAAQNGFAAGDDLATLGGTLLNYKETPWSKNTSGASPFTNKLPGINFKRK